MKKTVVAVLITTLLGGCAALQEFQRDQEPSYVAPEITTSETNRIAADLSDFLSQQLPPAKTTLAFKSDSTLFHKVLLVRLASKGYGIATGQAPSGAVLVRYYATILDNGILARVSYQDKIATRYYRRTEKGLSLGNVAIRGVMK